MSQKIAETILSVVGPGRILHYGCRDRGLVSALLRLGCDAWGHSDCGIADRHARIVPKAEVGTEFDTVVVDLAAAATIADLEAHIGSLRALTTRTLVLLGDASDCGLQASSADNTAFEDLVLAAGFRRHPGAFPVARYQRLNNTAREPFLFFEKLPDDVLVRWPLEKLLENRDLHMDMSREAGPRSDAHLVRYALAAEYVRPGDTVLDCACGLGYGSALLAAASRGARFIGVDIDPGSIAYARDVFSRYPVEYHAASALALDFIPDHSIDLVVSFETIEHLPEFVPFLDEITRVLKPDGRVVGSVPHLWVDETGRDPNPHHFHAFDYPRIRDAFERHFTVEARFGQTAPGGVKLHDAPRQLEPRPLRLNAEEADTEWWIIVAVADPSRHRALPYSHPEFDPCTVQTRPALTDFGKHYDNPWIYRQLIQNGQRVRDPEVLERLLDASAAVSTTGSADSGAILTVRAYRSLLESDLATRPGLFDAIDRYLMQPAENPHVHRWQISLAYVAGLLSLDAGHRESAASYLHRVTTSDPIRFSPLITTKVIGAHFLAGTMALVDRRPDDARQSFRAGIEASRRALHAPDADAIGDPDHPLAFGFAELAEIADMASQCATALDLVDSFGQRPGIFWRHVDTRRFGLLTWIRNLEGDWRAERERFAAEQRRMAERIEHLERTCSLRALVPLRMKEVMFEILPGLLRQLLRKRRRKVDEGGR